MQWLFRKIDGMFQGLSEGERSNFIYYSHLNLLIPFFQQLPFKLEMKLNASKELLGLHGHYGCLMR